MRTSIIRKIVLSVLIVSIFALGDSTRFARAQEQPNPNGTVGGSNPIALLGTAIGLGVAYAVSEGWFGDITDAVGDFFSDAVDFFDDLFSGGDDPPDPQPPPRTPRDQVEDVAEDFGENQGRSAGAAPTVSAGDVPRPRVTPDLGPSGPPVDQGQAAPTADAQALRTQAGDPGSDAGKTDPISLHRGEFVYSVVDHEVNGENPRLSLVRTYRSRVDFEGPLGPAWNHSFNVRLFEGGNPNLCREEIQISMGDLRSIAMRPDTPEGALAPVYKPVAPGMPATLYRQRETLVNQHCRWELKLPTAERYCFDERGLATRFISPNGNYLEITWESFDTEDGDDYRVSHVRRMLDGQATHRLQFAYYEDDARRLRSTELSMLPDPTSGLTPAPIRATNVDYTYNGRGELYQVSDTIVRATYGYLDAPDDAPEGVPLEGLSEYCTSLCAPTTPAACTTTQPFCLAQARATQPQCGTLCADGCTSACTSAFDDPVVKRDAIDACTAQGHHEQRCLALYNEARPIFLAACEEGCRPECESTCRDVEGLTSSCESSCFGACIDVASDSTKYIYGIERDLQHNLESVTDGEGRRLVYNQYGKNPRHPSFDAAIEQQQGADQPFVSLRYVDLTPPRGKGALARETSFAPDLGFPNAIAGGLVSDPTSAQLARQHAPDGSLRLCEPDTVADVRPTSFVPIGTGSVLAGLAGQLPITSPALGDRRAVLAEVGEAGSVTLWSSAVPNANTRLSFGGRVLSAEVSGSTLTPSTAREMVRLVARRVEAEAGTRSAGPVAAEQTVALFASGSLTVNDRAEVRSSSGGFGRIANSGTDTVTIGADAKVGAIQNRGTTVLRDRARIQGDLESQGTVTGLNQATVEGDVVSATSLESFPVELNVQFPDGGADASLEPDRERSLEPGRYRNVSVKSRSRLLLRSGIYYLDALGVEPDAKLVLSTRSGPVYLYIKNQLTFRGSVQTDRGTDDGLFIGYLGSGSAPIERAFSGTIVAPNGELILAQGGGSHAGSFFAKRIEVRPDVIVRHVPFRAPWTGPSRKAPGAYDDAKTFPEPVSLTIPARAALFGGKAGSSVLELTFDNAACSYRGSSGPAPFGLGARFLYLDSCTEGSEAGDPLVTRSVSAHLQAGAVADASGTGEIEAAVGLSVTPSNTSPGQRLMLELGAAPGDLVVAAVGADGVELLGKVAGFVALTHGTCRSPFSVESDGIEGELVPTPIAACDADLRMVPIAELDASFGQSWVDTFGGAPVVDIRASGRGDGRLELSAALDRDLSVEEWGRALSTLGDAASPLLTRVSAGPVRVLGPLLPGNASSTEVVLSRAEGLSAHRSPAVRDEIVRQIDGIRIDSLVDGLLDRTVVDRSEPNGDITFNTVMSGGLRDRLDELLTTTGIRTDGLATANPPGAECNANRNYRSPYRSSQREAARARFATTVSAADRETMIAYYSDRGDNLRVVNLTRGVVDDYEYDPRHNRTGSLRHPLDSLAALEPRLCSTVDARGLTTSLTRIGHDGPSTTQCMLYDDDGPWLTRMSRPNDAGDVVLSRAYNRAGQLLKAANDGGEVTTFHYANGRLERTVEPGQVVTEFLDYDSRVGLPRQIVADAEGQQRTTELTFDLYGHVRTIERAGFGPSETWAWLDHLRLDHHTVSTEDGAHREDYTYNDAGQVRSIVSTLGSVEYRYDSAGLLQRIIETSGERRRTQCYSHRSDGSVAAFVDTNGARFAESRAYVGTSTISSIYASQSTDPACALHEGEPTQIPNAPVFVVTSDGANRPVKVVDQAGLVTAYHYDSFGRLRTSTQGDDDYRITKATYYDALDRVTAELDLEGEVDAPQTIAEASNLDAIPGAVLATFRGYDRASRPSRSSVYVRHPASGFQKASDVEHAFSPALRRVVTTSKTAVGDHVRTMLFDELGRLASDTDSSGNSTTASYPDFLTQELRVRGPEGTNITVRREFTSRGGVRALTVSGKQIAANHYDAAGRLIASEDEGSATQVTEFDGFNQPLQIQRVSLDPTIQGGEVRSFAYDGRGRLQSVSTGGSLVARFVYDLFGRRARERRPSTVTGGSSLVDRVTTYVAASDLPSTVELPSGRLLEFTYVPGRSLVDTVLADASNVPESQRVGSPVLRADLDYSASGHLTQARLMDGALVLANVQRDVDGAGRIVEDALSGHSVTRGYSLGLGVTSLSNNGETFEYSRRSDGKLERIAKGSATLVDFNYLGAGPPQTIEFGNGTFETRGYDARGRLTSQTLSSVLAMTYGYGADGHTRRSTVSDGGEYDSLLLALDGAGRVSAELRNVPVSGSSLVSGAITNDQIEALTGSATDARFYSFDSAANWTEVSGLEGLVFDPDPSAANTYRNTPLGTASYDADGRMIRAGSRTLRYDAFGRLGEVTDGDDTCAYVHDPLGRRVTETCNGVSVRFGYDAENLVAERTGSQITRTLHADGPSTPLVRIGPAGEQYLFAGKDGSIRAVLDDDGNLLERYDYTAFGETTVTAAPGRARTGNRFGFQGHVFDEATGFYQMRARYYAPGWGRFITPDPLGVFGGANLYAFARNRPADLWDPFGLTAQSNPAAERMRLTSPQPCIINCHSRDGRVAPYRPSPTAEQYANALRDALNSPNPETRIQAQLALGGAAIGLAPTYVGDYVSAFTSIVRFGAFPSWEGFAEACADCVGAALPFVGPAGSFSRVERIGNFQEFAGDAGRLEDFVDGVGDLERAGDFVDTSGGSARFFHGSTTEGSESVLAGLRPVSTATGPHPPGSFFTHDGGLPNALEAASHWPIVQGKTNSLGVRVVEMVVPIHILDDLTARGLVRSGNVPGLPGFPKETVFLPGALETLNQSATFKVISGSF